jgi:putative sigma-54 modulation protein
MKVTVTARHMDLTDVMKEYAYDKGERLGKFFDNIRKIEIILDAEKDKRYRAEVVVSATKGQVLVCERTDVSATAALDGVLDKMERQLTKFKEKLRGKHGGNGAARFPRRQTEIAAGDNFGDLWW